MEARRLPVPTLMADWPLGGAGKAVGATTAAAAAAECPFTASVAAEGVVAEIRFGPWPFSEWAS